MATQSGLIEAVKTSCLARGIRLTAQAERQLSLGGTAPLTVHEYATTGGVTFVLPGNVYVNAPFDDWYVNDVAEVSLDLTDGDGQYVVRYQDAAVPVDRVLPLPGYLDRVDDAGRHVTDVCMSHADRIRLSPIDGCAYDCSFCDIPATRYTRHPVEQLLAALDVAMADTALPPRHVLISGGSPGRRDYHYFEEICEKVIADCPLPVDIMMAAIPGDPGFVDRMIDAGIHGFSLNIELFSSDASSLYIRGKHRHARPGFEPFVERAVSRLGSSGRVRSLILVGLEPPEETLAGVEYLASLGADPVLSPFRPAQNTKLERHEPIATELLTSVLREARGIVARHGVALGPRCLPCQHNTLTFPVDVETATPAPAS